MSGPACADELSLHIRLYCNYLFDLSTRLACQWFLSIHYLVVRCGFYFDSHSLTHSNNIRFSIDSLLSLSTIELSCLCHKFLHLYIHFSHCFTYIFLHLWICYPSVPEVDKRQASVIAFVWFYRCQCMQCARPVVQSLAHMLYCFET